MGRIVAKITTYDGMESSFWGIYNKGTSVMEDYFFEDKDTAEIGMHHTNLFKNYAGIIHTKEVLRLLHLALKED